MSKLEELIKKLCPDGVIFKRLGEITNFRNGKGHEKNIVMSGNYIVVNAKFISTDGKVKKYSNKQISPLFPEDILMVMSDLPNGKALAKCFVVDSENKYTLNQRICALDIKDKKKLNYRFLYYILNRNVQLLKYDNKVDQTNLKKEQILKIKIPVPPIEVQNEIVRILDNFTELKAELKAELEARKKQYEYYLNYLISEAKELTKKNIYEVTIWDKKFNAVEKFKQPKIKKYPVLIAKDLFDLKKEKGDVFLLSTGTETGWTTNEYAGDNLCEGEVVTIPWGKSRPVEEVMKYYNGKFVTGDNRIATSNNTDILKNKYLYYWLKHKGRKIDEFYRGSGIQHPNMKKVLDMEIMIPKIEEQERIVSILDRFEKLCNDISDGLPAELEARKKQYEYYRDKLLNFKELKVENKE